jgi:hypothetical protein
MSKKTLATKGSSLITIIIILVVVGLIGLGGWYVARQKNKEQPDPNNNPPTQLQDPSAQNETSDWVLVTTQGGAFSMKVPDGWTLTKYPNDFLGAITVIYKPGIRAVIKSSETEYAGHSLRFRASVTTLDDAGLGPQWASPQPGLQESIEEFNIGTLQGKRYKGVFSQDLNQTIYEYVFSLGSNKKLDVVYTVDHASSDKDDVATIEKAIRSIKLNST